MDIEEILKARKLAATTTKSYLSTFKVLEDRVRQAGFYKPKYGWMKQDGKVLSLISEKYQPLSRRNILNILIIISKAMKFPYDKYEAERDSYNKGYWKEQREGTKNEKQKKAWTESVDLLEVLAAHKVKFNRVKRSSAPLSDRTLKVLNEALLIIYYLTPFSMNGDDKLNYGVSRNDLGTLNVVTSIKDAKDKSENYALVMKTKVELIFNKFKTDKSIGQVRFTLPKIVASAVRDYITLTDHIESGNPRRLMVSDVEGRAFSKHMITAYLNRIFKREVGTPISTTALRHMFLSDKFGKEQGAREDIADKMMHSSTVASNVYIKNKK